MIQFLVPLFGAAYIADRATNWHPPVKCPKARGIDPLGSGGFGASRDGGSRLHKGLDIVSKPGQTVYAPIGGVLYTFATEKGLRGVQIRGENGDVAKVIYLRPFLESGSIVSKGQEVGEAVDIVPFYGRGITNHVHFEAIIDGVSLNPVKKLPLLTRMLL